MVGRKKRMVNYCGKMYKEDVDEKCEGRTERKQGRKKTGESIAQVSRERINGHVNRFA